MFGSKLLGLTLSALMSVTPVDFFIPTEITFPFTRTDVVKWRVSWDIDDLGTIAPSSTKHNYVINYQADIYCSSACTVAWASGFDGYNLTSDHIIWHWYERVNEETPAVLLNSLTGFNAVGTQSRANTYTSEDDYSNTTLNLEYPNNGTINLTIAIPALTEAMIEYNNSYWTEELYFLTLANALRDTKDIPSSVMQQYTQYINDGDYSQAIQYISNYYETTNVTNNEETLQVISDFNTHDTTLNNYYNTENNFTNQVETDFQNQEQQLPNLNNSIQELQVPKFLQSANWVTAQFNRMTSNNAFGSLITFSLLTGFILALIGRFKR